MSKKDDFVARIAVGHDQAPLSAVFRIWSPSGKSDVYAAVRDIACRYAPAGKLGVMPGIQTKHLSR